MGVATLVAIVAVAIVITLSSLRGLAMRENESHVQTLLRALGESLNREVLAAESAGIPIAKSLQTLTETDQSLQSEMNDTRWSGELLFRHGYYVKLRQGPTGTEPFLEAWPSREGRTGKRRFTWQATTGLSVIAPNENRESD